MSYYQKLNLPKIPVNNPEFLSKIKGPGYNLVLPDRILTDEVMNIFAEHNLKPKFVVLFRGAPPGEDGKPEVRIIHTDIQLKPGITQDNKNNKDSWKKLIFGINWELFDTNNLFSWWDMSSHKEYLPTENDLPKQYEYLNGIHYGKRLQMGILPGSVKLAETLIDGPTMVRTNIPHMTLFNGQPGVQRVGVSVRFDESGINSWEDALEITSALHVK